MLRVGKSKLKALAAASALAVPTISFAQGQAVTTNGTWTFNGAQTWSIVSSWQGGIVPSTGTNAGSDGARAVFPASSIGSTTIANVHLDTVRTLGRLDFAGGTFTASNAYNITGAVNLTLNANTTINADSGTHRISSVVIGNGTIIKTGVGTVILAASGTNNFNNNSMQILDGVLVAASVNSLNGAVAIATGGGGVLELGLAGAGSLNLSPGNMGAKVIGLGSGGAAGGTVRNVNGNNSMQGNWFVLASGSANMVAGSLSLNGSIFDSDVGTLNGFTKAGSGTFTANQLVITGVFANTTGQTNLVGTGSSSVGTANINGGTFAISNGTFTVVNPMAVSAAAQVQLTNGTFIGNLTTSASASYIANGGSFLSTLNANGGTGAFTGGTNRVATFNVGGGVHNINAGAIVNLTNTATVTGGSLTLGAATINGNVTVAGGNFTVNGGRINSVVTVNSGTALFTGGRLSTLAVNGGTARMTVQATANAPGGVLRMSQLAVAGGQALDVNNNTLIINNGSLTTIKNLLKTGLENGGNYDWVGPGIRDTKASTDNITFGGVLYGLGVLFNNDAPFGGAGDPIYTNFSGQVLTGNEILVKHTYMGDADLSGSIDGTDYALIDAGFVNLGSDWVLGDFDYSGAIDGTDYALIDASFVNQGAPLAPDMVALHTAMFGDEYTATLTALQSGTVPEPGTLGLAMVGFAGLALRRRRAR